MVNGVNIPLEIFGYIGTALVIISMLMTSLIKLRIINMCGSIISTTYSIIVGAWPIVVMNICILCINMYHTVKSLRRKKVLSDVIVSPKDKSLLHFISLYEDRIKADNNEYDFNANEYSETHLIYFENKIIAFFAGKREAETYLLNASYIIDGSGVSEKEIFLALRGSGIKQIKIDFGARLPYGIDKMGFKKTGTDLTLDL
ncbi:MAG: YgjV family protein [Ruminococcaceae bacterium]|nr:YgjV family protein [Oscillospiraceae bacterium]